MTGSEVRFFSAAPFFSFYPLQDSDSVKDMRHCLEAILVITLLHLIGLLPIRWGSALGAKLGQYIGPKTRRHQVALDNLTLAMPEKTDAEREQIAAHMWAHLGRVLAELAYLKKGKLFGRVTAIEGEANMPENNQPAIFVSGHFGQWELPVPLAHQRGIDIAAVYRHINNPYLDKWLKTMRGRQADLLIRKGPKSVSVILKALRSGLSIGLLADQKITDGLTLPFFGQPATTNSTPARLALKFNYPIIPVFVTRTQETSFTLTIEPPIDTSSGDIETITRHINKVLEQRIRAHPEQWLWTHRRWKR